MILSINGWGGFYCPEFDFIFCTDTQSCIHEQGHRLDWSLDRPSQTDEFKALIDAFLPILLENTTCIRETENCLYTEAYARLWWAAGGDINALPEMFQPFYRVTE
ncbi:MAG TPA: hypothetical protein VMW53_07240 [archaeon]|nr:hypothetical protein [archaeon]